MKLIGCRSLNKVIKIKTTEFQTLSTVSLLKELINASKTSTNKTIYKVYEVNKDMDFGSKLEKKVFYKNHSNSFKYILTITETLIKLSRSYLLLKIKHIFIYKFK